MEAARPGARRAAGAPARSDPRARCPQPHAGRLLRGAPLVVSRRVAFPVGSRWKYGRARHYLAVSEFVKRVLMRAACRRRRSAWCTTACPLLEPARGSAVLAPANADDPRKGAPLAVEAARLAGVELLLSTDLEQRSAPGRDLRLHHAQRRPGLGRAAGDVGRRAGDGQQRGRPARDRSATARTACWWKTPPPAIAAAIRAVARRPGAAHADTGRGRAPDRDGAIHRGPHGPPYHGSLTGRCSL